MSIAVYYVFAVVAGVVAGALITWLFGRFPDKWLQDYGVTPEDPNYRPSKRMRPFPEGLIAVLFCVACYVVTIALCYNDYIATFRPMHLAVIFLVIPVLNLVMMADKLNRIIPDQFSIYIGLCGVLSVAADLLEGSVWFTPGVACSRLIPVSAFTCACIICSSAFAVTVAIFQLFRCLNYP